VVSSDPGGTVSLAVAIASAEAALRQARAEGPRSTNRPGHSFLESMPKLEMKGGGQGEQRCVCVIE